MLCNVNREVILYAGSVVVNSYIQLSSCAAYILFSAFNTGDEIDNISRFASEKMAYSIECMVARMGGLEGGFANEMMATCGAAGVATRRDSGC